MTDIKDVMEAERKRRDALTDDEREAEDREREARRARAFTGIADAARLVEQGTDLSQYSHALADFSATSIGKVEDLLKSYNFDDAIQSATERATQAIGSFDLSDYTEQLAQAANALPSQHALAAFNADHIMGVLRDAEKTRADQLEDAIRSLGVGDVAQYDASMDTHLRNPIDISSTRESLDFPMVPDDVFVESPLPKMLETLEDVREHQKATVVVMEKMRQSQSAHNQEMIGVLSELHKGQKELNRQMQGTSTRDILLLFIATMTLVAAIVVPRIVAAI